ncbi:MAG: hypothetical protein IJC49_01140 [Clostridia bacterium]|nr:hypothetical protein [Clostridia bacterium]
MKLKLKSLIAGLILPAAMLFAAGCGSDPTPYEVNDGKGYTVSVKYDANGGNFDTNTSVIMDSFNVSDMEKNPDGTVSIALLSPDDTRRGSSNSFTPSLGGHFLAGFYSERTEGKDAEGNTVYTYAGLWDFEKDVLKVDASKSYSAAEPVMTLYAAWIPMFKVNFYNLDDGKLLETYTFNPTEKDGLILPKWDTESGSISMNDFPKRTGYTFDTAYLDKNGQNKIDTELLYHSGKVNTENGTAENPSMDVYVSWTEGDIYHIYTAKQFAANYKAGGTYIIHEDLDFTDIIWPSALTTGVFSGKIEGNGHTFKNVTVVQNDIGKTSFGIFGQLADGAEVTGVTFENAKFTVKKGIRTAGSSYGLFAGSVSEKATVKDVVFKDSVLEIDSGCFFATDDYSLGTVCGTGNADIDDSGIRCEVVGENPDRLTVTITDGAVDIKVND